MAETDPTSIRSLAVSPEDVADAYVYTQQNPGEAVLRVTPPFHGRMRARLHVYRVDDAPVTGAIHVDPAAVVADDVVADYPRLEDALEIAENDDAAEESDSDETNPDDRRERHARAVERWQRRARQSIVDEIELETDAGTHRVAVTAIG